MIYLGSSESALIIFVHLATCRGCSPETRTNKSPGHMISNNLALVTSKSSDKDRAPDKKGHWRYSKDNYSYSSMKTYVVTPHWRDGSNDGSHHMFLKRKKIIFELSSIPPLIWRSVLVLKEKYGKLCRNYPFHTFLSGALKCSLITAFTCHIKSEASIDPR